MKNERFSDAQIMAVLKQGNHSIGTACMSGGNLILALPVLTVTATSTLVEYDAAKSNFCDINLVQV